MLQPRLTVRPKLQQRHLVAHEGGPCGLSFEDQIVHRSVQPEHLAARKVHRARFRYSASAPSEPPYRADTAVGLGAGAAVGVLLIRCKTSQEPTRSMGT